MDAVPKESILLYKNTATPEIASQSYIFRNITELTFSFNLSTLSTRPLPLQRQKARYVTVIIIKDGESGSLSHF